MQVTLLYFDGCPNWRTAEARLRAALDRVGASDADVVRRQVASDDAEALGFRGSPTILVDGRDPFTAADALGGLACRVYPTGQGLDGVPTVEQLVEVLQRDAAAERADLAEALAPQDR